MARKLTKPNDIKIFILYLMDKIGYPLEYNAIAEIIVEDDIVNYFDFAQNFSELEDAGHIEMITEIENGKQEQKYQVTKTGRTVAEGLNSVLARAIKDRGYRSALRHFSLSKRGAVLDQAVRLDGEGVLFHGSIKDKKGLQLDLSLRVENENQLRLMKKVFADRPEVVLRGIIAVMTGDLELALGAGSKGKK